MIKKILLLIFCLTLILPTMSGLFAFAEDENLVSGKPYTIDIEANISNGFPARVYDDTGYKLTDGKIATANFNDTAWLSLFRGVSQSITFDLGEVMAVNGFSLGELCLVSYGVQALRWVELSVSLDGDDYFLINRTEDSDTIAKADIKRNVVSAETDYYKAQYVRVKLNVDVFVYLDEIEIYGRALDGSEKTADEPQIDRDAVYAFAPNKVEALGGVSNACLIYNGDYYSKNETAPGGPIGNNTFNELLPFVVYKDLISNELDTMFESLLFLPLHQKENTEYDLTRKSGWQHYLTNTIGKETDMNLTALNKLIGEYKEQLGFGDDFKYPVVMTVPSFKPSKSVFGEINGENLTYGTKDDINKITEWYVDLSINAFNAENFENLSLTGFYWYAELVYYANMDDSNDAERVIVHFNEYVHSKDLGTMWIPYYCAPGFTRARSMGFDSATLQNGYAFPDEKNANGMVQPGVVLDQIKMSYKYGLGSEFEMQNISDVTKRVEQYVHDNFTEGVMKNSFSAFYQGGGPGMLYNAATSGAPREVYDLVYKYLKGTYSENPPQLFLDGPVFVEKNSEKVSYFLKIVDDDSTKNKILLADSTSAANGEAKIRPSGNFTYIPNKDFVGEDSFTFQLTDGQSLSEVYTVNIIVVEKLFELSTENSKIIDKAYRIDDKDITTDSDVFEIAVDSSGKILSAKLTKNITVPEGGYVICATGTMIDDIKSYANIGDKVSFDPVSNSIYFTEIKEINDVTPEAGASSSLIWIIMAVGVVVLGAAAGIIIKFKRGN